MRNYEGSTNLQGLGEVQGIQAKNLQVGDFQVWNYGSSSEIINIETSKTGKTLTITYKWFNKHARVEEGKWVGEWQEQIRKFRATSIVVVKELNPVKETSIVKQIKKESDEVLSYINTGTLETQKESLEAVSQQLDKVYSAIENNLENEEIRLQLRDIEKTLKYYYAWLDEMIEKQTMPDANDFNNIETLKTVYITNWNELPQEIQNYILLCDKYWINLQSIELYKDNKIVASIGISGHRKNDIEINSIGAGDKGNLFQWNTTDGYTLNNLEVSQNKIKVTHNEYEKIMKELASRVYKKDKTKITMKQYDEILEQYEVLPFEINTDNDELKKVINTYADSEDIEADRTIYRGSIDKGILYNLYQNSSYNDLYIEYYQMIICKDELKTILTYCEGDFIAEVYNSIDSYNLGVKNTKKFIEEM